MLSKGETFSSIITRCLTVCAEFFEKTMDKQTFKDELKEVKNNRT